MFLTIATLSNSDQEKVLEMVQNLGSKKKNALKKTPLRPKAGFLKGAFQPPVETDVDETQNEPPQEKLNNTEPQNEL